MITVRPHALLMRIKINFLSLMQKFRLSWTGERIIILSAISTGFYSSDSLQQLLRNINNTLHYTVSIHCLLSSYRTQPCRWCCRSQMWWNYDPPFKIVSSVNTWKYSRHNCGVWAASEELEMKDNTSSAVQCHHLLLVTRAPWPGLEDIYTNRCLILPLV